MNKIGIFAYDRVGSNILNLFRINNYRPTFVCLKDDSLYSLAKSITNNVIKWSSNNDTYNRILSICGKVDLCILAWWPFIIKDPMFNLSKNGFLNTHPSYLPYNRGKHYYFWSIVEDCPFGVTIHWVDEGIDTGDVAFQRRIVIDQLDNGYSLREKSEDEMINLFRDNFSNIVDLKIPKEKQDLSLGSYHWGSELDVVSKINLDRFYKPMELINIIRGRSGFKNGGSWFEVDGKKYIISVSIKEDK